MAPIFEDDPALLIALGDTSRRRGFTVLPAAELVLAGLPSSSALVADAARAALADARPLSGNGDKVPLAEAPIVRALSEAVEPPTTALAAAD